MARAFVLILVVVAITPLYLAFFRKVNNAVTDAPGPYTAAQITEGLHCVDQLLSWPYAMKTALLKRIGTADTIAVVKIEPGPLGPDKTHKLTVFYQILRIGQPVPETNKATGTLVNADCTFRLTTIER